MEVGKYQMIQNLHPVDKIIDLDFGASNLPIAPTGKIRTEVIVQEYPPHQTSVLFWTSLAPCRSYPRRPRWDPALRRQNAWSMGTIPRKALPWAQENAQKKTWWDCESVEYALPLQFLLFSTAFWKITIITIIFEKVQFALGHQRSCRFWKGQLCLLFFQL